MCFCRENGASTGSVRQLYSSCFLFLLSLTLFSITKKLKKPKTNKLLSRTETVGPTVRHCGRAK